LRNLVAVRDIVGGLNRDARVDVANDVMERIRRRTRPRLPLANFRPWSSRTRKLAASAGMFAAVAGLALVVNFSSIEHKPVHRAGGEIGGSVDNQIADSGSDSTVSADSLSNDAATVAVVAPAASYAINLDQAGATGAIHVAGTSSKSSVAEPDRPALQKDLEVSRGLLDNPNKRRFFLVKNGHDGNAEQQVASIVERTTRFNFCKITVSQGIVIDPRHPDRATVFAFLVNPNEVDRVLDQLKAVLPDAIEESPADPAIVTQLADISQVKVSPPAPLAEVMIPREDLALRTRVEGSAETAAHPAATPARHNSIDPGNDHSRNDASTGSTPAGSAREVDQGKVLVRATEALRLPDTPASGVARSPQPMPMTGVVSSQSVSPTTLGKREKSKDLVLVFVWVCQPTPS
jgi:hypothetical protein